MKKAELALPEIMLIAGTRVMLGAGGALLLADQLEKGERKKIGWALFLIGAISTIPLVMDVLSKRK
jgi:H+/gluconate symporter-like permease